MWWACVGGSPLVPSGNTEEGFMILGADGAVLHGEGAFHPFSLR